ncbi:lysylphosphatidylglycerol synthase transmembrane domain-containing protein [Lyngbya confervoides]|uniref:YbhN family protein n=1 Tax=Lyngbya confervoides BDU141951 TaxID=1574623 RepID=A0ABD4SYD3_9CYAN|nr:YbhN family protein [Lyngbya confervoides]MCM1981444.1 YbhN family protein [Lyngbya confervoides BDU141951]
MRRYLSPLLRWGVLGATFLFLAKTLAGNWHEVRSLQLQSHALLYCAIALGIALIAQIWSAFIWGWILASFKETPPKRWMIVTFLKNSPAKYIPGSVWHMYGRVMAAREKGIAVEPTTLSVMIEPVFTVAGALGLALFNNEHPQYKFLSLGLVLIALHPQVLRLAWQIIRRFQGQKFQAVEMQHYPFHILLGATLFMTMRGLTFLCVVFAFTPVDWDAFRPLVSGFSFAWLLSLVIPSPGGLGVFEASALNVLSDYLTPGLLIGAVALYRFINISAEAIGAGAAFLVSEE